MVESGVGCDFVGASCRWHGGEVSIDIDPALFPFISFTGSNIFNPTVLNDSPLFHLLSNSSAWVSFPLLLPFRFSTLHPDPQPSNGK